MTSRAQPIYSSGKAAVAERNLVRYYFAFDAFFHASGETNPGRRHELQTSNWFEETEKYPQLHELDRDEYLSEKRKEKENQLQLQSDLH